jgi:CRISPR system Cascade subunit CasD
MDCLLLRFDAPLMSFGGVVVDQINPTESFPGSSMLTGLLANALGWEHKDVERLHALQDRLRFAARWDAEPERLTDYQTVDLGQDFLVDTGWTTRGRREDRGKGEATSATHQRWRTYWANGVMTVAVGLGEAGDPSLEALEAALRRPARPLFLGRKPCLPSGPLLLGRRECSSLRDALAKEPPAGVAPRPVPARCRAIWPLDEAEGSARTERYDLRDWPNNIHRGGEVYAEGFLEVAP